jgi:oligosaccharide repeat unit polymerase
MPVIILILSLLSIIIACKFYTAICGKITVLSVTSYFLLLYIVFIYIGAILLNICKFEWDYYLGIYYRRDILLKIWIYATIEIFLLILGFAIINILFDINKLGQAKTDMLNNDFLIKKADMSNRIFYFIIFSFSMSLTILLIYRNIIEKLPIEYVFSGLDKASLALYRSDATNNFTGKLHRYRIFTENLPLLLFIIVAFIKNHGKKRWSVLFYILLIYNAFTQIMYLRKGNIILFSIFCMLIYFFKKKKIDRQLLIKVSIFSIVLIVIMYIYFMGISGNTVEILNMAANRTFIGQVRPLFWYFTYVEDFGLIYGRSFPNPSNIFPFEQFPIAFEIMKYSQGGTENEIVGSLPTVFFGELYVNFGNIGFIFGSIILGMILQFVDIYFMKKILKSKTILKCALYLFLINYFSQYSMSGVLKLFLDLYLWITIIYILIYIIIHRTHINKNTYNNN